MVQTYQDMEIIIIDDHADPMELACIEEYKIGFLLNYTIWRKNRRCSCKNLGLDLATGEYIYFLIVMITYMKMLLNC